MPAAPSDRPNNKSQSKDRSSRDPGAATVPTISGKVVILSIGIVSLSMASFAWWYRYEQGNESLRYWGPEAASRVSAAPLVELLTLGPAADDSAPPNPESPSPESTPDEGLPSGLQVVAILDITRARGLIHARHCLLEDATFRWNESRSDKTPARWDYALRFTRETRDDGPRSTTVLFDLKAARVAPAPGRGAVAIQPDIAQAFAELFERELALDSAGKPDGDATNDEADSAGR